LGGAESVGDFQIGYPDSPIYIPISKSIAQVGINLILSDYEFGVILVFILMVLITDTGVQSSSLSGNGLRRTKKPTRNCCSLKYE
jgi:hypothetical protein